MTMGFCPSRSTQIAASTTSWPSSLRELLHLDGDAIGQLLDQLQGELLADRLGDRNSMPRSVRCSGGNSRGDSGSVRAIDFDEVARG